ncbi:MAG: acyl carrier protein [Odoribacter sp.]
MERAEIFNQLNAIFEDIIDEGSVVLTDTTRSVDVEGWDSLTHIQLIVAIEKSLRIKFTSDEIISWKNVGEMVDCILLK